MKILAIIGLIARIVVSAICFYIGDYELLITKTGISYCILGLFAAVNNAHIKSENIEQVLCIIFPEYWGVTAIYNLITKQWNKLP